MKKESKPCEHQWEDLYVFRTTDGGRFVQKRCKKCQETKYEEIEKHCAAVDSQKEMEVTSNG